MKKLTVLTLTLFVIASSYSLALIFSEKIAGFRVHPESLADLGLHAEPTYVILLAVFGTAITASFGDFADECLSDALLLCLLLADLGMLLVPQQIAAICSKIFQKIANALGALVFKSVLELIKSHIRKRAEENDDARVAQHLVDDGGEVASS